jgi:hypothetical protein
MVFVAKGRDFHIESEHETPRVKHAYSMEELEKGRVSLTTKLNFIEENGIKEFPSIIKTTLRNDIAHFKFQIKDNTLYIRDKPALPQVIIGAIGVLKAVTAIEDLLNNCLKGWIKSE